MIQQIIKDPWSWICTIGPLFIQWIMAHANTMVGLMMGVGGIITIYFGIREKIKKNKLLDMEIREKEQDRRDRNERRRRNKN